MYCSISNWGDVLSRVSQGSALAPVLFCVYINYLPTHVSCSIKMFDDNFDSMAQSLILLILWLSNMILII